MTEQLAALTRRRESCSSLRRSHALRLCANDGATTRKRSFLGEEAPRLVRGDAPSACRIGVDLPVRSRHEGAPALHRPVTAHGLMHSSCSVPSPTYVALKEVVRGPAPFELEFPTTDPPQLSAEEVDCFNRISLSRVEYLCLKGSVTALLGRCGSAVDSVHLRSTLLADEDMQRVLAPTGDEDSDVPHDAVHVDVSDCEIGPMAAPVLAAFLARAPSLHTLCAASCDIADSPGAQFLRPLASQDALTSLNLRGNRLGCAAATVSLALSPRVVAIPPSAHPPVRRRLWRPSSALA